MTTSPCNCLLQLTPENGSLSVLLTLCERIIRGWRAEDTVLLCGRMLLAAVPRTDVSHLDQRANLRRQRLTDGLTRGVDAPAVQECGSHTHISITSVSPILTQMPSCSHYEDCKLPICLSVFSLGLWLCSFVVIKPTFIVMYCLYLDLREMSSESLVKKKTFFSHI